MTDSQCSRESKLEIDKEVRGDVLPNFSVQREGEESGIIEPPRRGEDADEEESLHGRADRIRTEAETGTGRMGPGKSRKRVSAGIKDAGRELADAFEHNQVEGLKDEETVGQPAGILFEIDSQGRLKIESKEAARAREVMSSDRAEALMLALCKPLQKFEFYRIGDLASPLQDPFDEDDYRSPRSRRWDGWAPGSLAPPTQNPGAW